MNTSSSSQLVFNHPAKPIMAAKPIVRRAVAAPPALVVFGVVRLEAGGRVTTPTRSYGRREAMVNVEIAPGVIGNKAPGKDLIMTEVATGRMTAFRYVNKQRRWFKSTSLVLKTLGSLPSPPLKRSWWRRLARSFFRRLGVRNAWSSLGAHAYQQLFTLLDGGRVELASGAALVAGDSPVPLPTGETLARNGLDVTLHDENGEVFERWRQERVEWRRLVTLRPTKLSEVGIDAELSPDGSLIFRPYGAVPFALKAGAPFTMHVDGQRTLVRPSQGSQIFIFDSHGVKVCELLIDGESVYELSGARDEWIYSMVGCPGGMERPKRTVEIMGGAISLMDTGASLILGRFYLPGEPLDLRHGAIRVGRAGWAPLYIRTATSAVGYVFEQREWWQLSPRVADSNFLSAKRFGAVDNYVSFSFQWLEAFIADAPGMASANRLISTMGRTAEGFGSQPVLFYLGPMIAMGLAIGMLYGYWVTRLVGIPWAAAWRAYRHIKRAIELA